MSSIKLDDNAAPSAPLTNLLSRDSLIVGAALLAAAVLAWAWLLNWRMDSMAPQPLSDAYLLPAFAMWAIMMVAMMVPSAAPMILLHARIDKAETKRRRAIHSLLFALAYLLVWVGFAAVAALYELTAAKRLCLDKCQSPLLFILRYWKPGAVGALRLGIVHGLFCLGCCWALMLLLFVGGLMNLAWVAILGILVLGEKLAPPAWRAERYVAAALFIGAIAALVA